MPEPDARLDPGSPAVEDVDDATVEAVGKLSEAMETVEVARGHLYAFHQLSGRADFLVGDAVEMLRDAGHADFGDELEREIVGRNVLPGRWTFQVVEEYAENYYEPLRRFDARGRELIGGHPHLFEAGLKRARRTTGAEGHEADPSEVGESTRQG
jgi:hypothetical protein